MPKTDEQVREEAIRAVANNQISPWTAELSKAGWDIEGIGKASCSFCDAPAKYSSPIGDFYCETCFTEVAPPSTEVELPPLDVTDNDMEIGLELARQQPGCLLKTQGDCNFAQRLACRERQLRETLISLRKVEAERTTAWEARHAWFEATGEANKRTWAAESANAELRKRVEELLTRIDVLDNALRGFVYQANGRPLEHYGMYRACKVTIDEDHLKRLNDLLRTQQEGAQG